MSKEQPRPRRSATSTSSVRLGSTYSDRHVRAAPEVKRKTGKLKRFVSGSARTAVIVALVLALVSILRLESTPVVFVKNDERSRRQLYQEYTTKVLSSSIMNKTKLTLQRSMLEQKLVEEFPEISAATISVDFLGRKPVLDLQLSSITAVVEGRGGKFALASNGRLAYQTNEKIGLTVKDESGIELKKGERVMRSDDSEFLGVITDVFSANNREVEYVKITTTPRELLLKQVNKTYEVKMYFEEDPYDQLGALFAVEKTLGEGGAVPTKYIDVRISEKVFWL